jgi:hypothetical protein
VGQQEHFRLSPLKSHGQMTHQKCDMGILAEA